jgi:hypothetical protein
MRSFRRLDGTIVYKDRALRTPFVKVSFAMLPISHFLVLA